MPLRSVDGQPPRSRRFRQAPALDDLAARMLGDDVSGDHLENAHGRVSEELYEHIKTRLIEWADETLNASAKKRAA